MKKYYGLRIESTMCGVVSYFLADTKEEIEKTFNLFQAYLDNEDETKVNEWCDLVYSGTMNWCNEYNDHSVGKIEDESNLYVLIDERWRPSRDKSPNKAYVFEMVKNYIDRF